MENTNQPSKETQVSQQLNRCFGKLDCLEGSINELEKRLERITITTSSSNEACIKERVEKSDLVAFANNLKSCADRISFAINRIDNLRNRIEL